jgi:hypothetical protein
MRSKHLIILYMYVRTLPTNGFPRNPLTIGDQPAKCQRGPLVGGIGNLETATTGWARPHQW